MCVRVSWNALWRLQAGPRTCLGQQMAVLEATLALGTLLRRFKFTLVNPKKVRYGITVTLPISGGLSVTAVPRGGAGSS